MKDTNAAKDARAANAGIAGQAAAEKRPARSRASGIQRRADIIGATLRVMAREGLRAVSHRAVATEAQVPLAATTYYFRDLEDLIVESFLHWSERQGGEIAQFQARVLALLAGFEASGLAPAARAEALAEAAALYVQDQVQRLRDAGVLEYAPLHEAIRMPRLRAALERQQQAHLGFLEKVHIALGSPRAALDAQITNSVLLGLEKAALLAQGPVDTRPALLRYLQGVLAPR